MPRPSFRPTAEQRKLVKTAASLGLRQEQICVLARIRSPKTLRKHFRQELDNGLAEATAAIARTAYEMARSGRYPAMLLFWLKCQAPAGVLAEAEEPAGQARGCAPIVVVGLPKDGATEDKVDAGT